MTKLFAVYGPNHPTVFIVATDKNNAWHQFTSGLNKGFDKSNSDVVEIQTLRQFLDYAPVEFTLNEDVSF